MIKATLMDLDNTLVDLSDVHFISLNKSLQEIENLSISREDHINIFNGLPTNKKLDILESRGEISGKNRHLIWKKKQEYTISSIQDCLTIDNDKIEFYEYLKTLNIDCCVVTNSILETAYLALKKTGQLPYIKFIISNEFVKNPKPHPEPYIKAMIKINSFPDECIIIEDSPIGIKCAELTGAHIWKVENSYEVNWENFKKFLINIK